MVLPLALDATKEEAITALKFYGSVTAYMSEDLLEDTSNVLQELAVLADIIKQLIPLASNVAEWYIHHHHHSDACQWCI